MSRLALALLVFCLSGPVSGGLPGVTEFAAKAAALTNAELDVLLARQVAAADVVAIGETVHGSAGLLDVQTRLIRYLVERHGIRLLVWEMPVLRGMELTRWAASCTRKTSAPPVDVLYFPTKADVPLWEWLCEYNRAHPAAPVVVRGMDVWDRPWEHYARLRNLAARAGVKAAAIEPVLKYCPAAQAASWEQANAAVMQAERDGRFLPALDFARCREHLARLMDAPRAAEEAGRDDAFELAVSASTLLGWLGFYDLSTSDDIESWNERDRAQGRNLHLLMQQHRAAKAVLAAHSSHASHGRSPANWWSYGDLKSGIHFFQASSGRPVFNIALTAYRASGAQGEWSLPIAVNSMDRRLYEAGHRFSFFPATAGFLKEHPKWWMQNGNFPGPFESGVEIVPADHFDAYFFLEASLLDAALPARPVWRP